MFISGNGYENNINIHTCDNKSVGLHSHNFLELAYVVKGTARHILNSDSAIISKGDYFILDYNAKHSYSSLYNGDFCVINCLFKPEFIDKSLTGCTNFGDVVNNYMIKYNYSTVNLSPANYIFKDSDGYILFILEKMLDEYEKKQSGYYEILRCKLIEIILLTMRKSSPENTVFSDSITEKMIDYAEKNLTEKNLLTSLSKMLNFSPSYLSRKFSSDTGTSFSKYIQKMRIEQSCRLLANTDKKISEIAALSGYSDMKFYNEIFKKTLGITPREFRNMHKNGR